MQEDGGDENRDEGNTVFKGTLDLDAMGLTKDDLRRLLLACYITQSTTGTELGIEVSLEEIQENLSPEEMQQLAEDGMTDPDETGYYYVKMQNDDTGEDMFFLATRGSVQIQNENEEELICVNNATFDYYINWFNGDVGLFTPSGEQARNTAMTMYTVREIGSIEMITATANGDYYSFSSKTINYAENSEISECMVPLELMIDLLQISASPDFLGAFENLVRDQDIILRVYTLTTTEETTTQRNYTINILADVRKTLEFKGTKTTEEGETLEHFVTEQRNFTYDLGNTTCEKSETSTNQSTDFDIKLISANTWYFKAERSVTKNTVTSYEYYNGDGTATSFTPESTENPMDSVPEYEVGGIDISGVTAMDDLQAGIQAETGINDIDLSNQRQELSRNLNSHDDVQSVIDYYTDNDGYPADSGLGYSDYRLENYHAEITNLTARSTSATEKKMKRTTQEILSVGTVDYQDNTDAFLGLWKNSSGQYEEGATFDPDGEKVPYTDLYEKDLETAYVGDLFENGDEILFDILEYSEHTQSYTMVMKYILYRYTGKDYGVTTFDDLMRSLGFGTRNTSGFPGGNTQEKVWWALINAGYSKIAAAAVLGNIQWESGFDPTTIEAGNGIGLGLCQWSFGRRTQLEAYIASKGTDTSDVNTQIEFLLGELTPGGGADGYASYQLSGVSSSAYDGNNYSASDWENATDIARATTAFMALFERPSYDPSTNHLANRIRSAEDYYNQYKDMEMPTIDSRIGPIELSGNNAVIMGAMLTEALRIADDDRYYYSQAERWGEWSYDCSSFAYRLYEEFFGIRIGTWTGDDYTSMAVAVITDMSESNLKPGDVLWIHSSARQHVGIYIGNGQYVHASGTRSGIKVSTYTPGYFTKAFRYVE